MKINFIILFLYCFISVFSQKNDIITSSYTSKRDYKLEVINKSELSYKLIYNQYFDNIRFGDPSLLSISDYYFSDDGFGKFYFKNIPPKDIEEYLHSKWYSTYDILVCTVDSCYILSDSIIEDQKIFDEMVYLRYMQGYATPINFNDTIFGCEIKDKIEVQVCDDTSIITTIVKTKKGELIFKDHNKMRIYENKEHTILYLMSFKWCEGQFLLYKIFRD